MKTNRFIFHSLIFLLGILITNQSIGQTFDCTIQNAHLPSANEFEFDVYIQTTSTDFNLRTVQMAFTIDPAFTPAGSTVIISYVAGSSQLQAYTPGPINQNISPSLSAFQMAANTGVSCTNGTIITNTGPTTGGTPIGAVRLASIHILSSSLFNNIFPNIAMITPTDPIVGGNVILKMAVTRWNSLDCSVTTTTTISNSGNYYTITDGIFNVADETGALTLNVSPNPNPGYSVNVDVCGMNTNEMATVRIFDAVGRTVNEHKVKADVFGRISTEVIPDKKLESGMYSINVISSTRKMVTAKLDVLKN